MMKRLISVSFIMLICGASLTVWAQNYSYKGVWNATTIYNGDYKTGRGDTVEYNAFNGKKLYWWCQWWSQGDVPGQFAPEGGTSPWVLINSHSFDPATKIPFQPKFWNGQIATSIQANQAVIPTWRDGAEAAYTIIHDDIGALNYDQHVKPGLEINRKHPKVKVSWGVFVGESDDTEWGLMKTILSEGHEMTCHSQNHTSAAEQWYWIYPDSTIPTTVKDPNIPKTIGGLKVVAFPKPSGPSGIGGTLITLDNEIATVKVVSNWTGVCPADTSLNKPPQITPKPGTVEITLPTGQKHYVRYDQVDTLTGQNTGKILAWGYTWLDYDPNSNLVPAGFAADKGMNWFVCKIWAIDKWKPADYVLNITTPKNTMDEKLYTPFAGKFGPYFPPTMSTSFYCYPYDAYSEATHDSLNNRGYISARGGAKSGKPMPADFYHPFRLDFDAFYMLDPAATTIFPANPHSRLGLEGMVDSILKYKGYMIRELHAVCNVGFDKINDNSQGGWWGGITATLYESHLTRLESLIDQYRLTTFNASEVIRYRLTTNAAKSASLTAEGSNHVLKVTSDPILDKYKDEISIIVKLPAACTQMDVKYKTTDPVWGNHPRRIPRMMSTDGTAWSINVNPYLGDAVIYPNVPWTGPITPIVFDSGKIGIKTAGKKVQYLRNGMIMLTVHPGAYTANIFTVDGRLKTTYTGIVNSHTLSLNAADLAQGSYIIKVTQKGTQAFTGKFITIK